MSRKTYPNTPEQEAARINAASGSPDGITAQQVANNRKLNESLTGSFGFGNSNSGPPENPFASLVGAVSAGITKTQELDAASLPSKFTQAKSELDDKISKLSGEIGSGHNGSTGNLTVSPFGGGAFNNAQRGSTQQAAYGSNTAITGMGGFADSVKNKFSGAVDSLRSAAGSTSNIAADISGTINKLTGGSLAGGLMKIAGQASSAAGMLNNVLSMKRAANLPKGAEEFKTQGEAVELDVSSKNDWRVRITCQWNIFNSPMFDELEKTGGVVWPYLPSITIASKADYTNINTVHSNYTQFAYKGSSVDDIQISGEFSCETEKDAAYWISATTFFRTATKMFFGTGPNAGNPPRICILKGYGSSVFNNTPVLIKSFSVDLKDDVNYIQCGYFGGTTWVPVLSTVSVTVSPVYTRERMRRFSLEQFSRGDLAVYEGKIGEF